MKRYTQGFKYFGPMEQSSDGEWVRHEDCEEAVTHQAELVVIKDDLIRSQADAINELSDLSKKVIDSNQSLFDEIDAQELQITRLTAYCVALILLALTSTMTVHL